MDDFRIAIVTTMAQMNDALSVRRAVFIEEQGVNEDEEIDDLDGDPESTAGIVHVVAYRRVLPVATGRLHTVEPTTQPAHIGRVAVVAKFRGIGLGNTVMEALHDEAQRRGYASIALAAQLQAIPFYERLGYVAGGDVYLDAGIEHRWMERRFGKPPPAGSSP